MVVMLQTNNTIEKQISGIFPKPGKTGIDWFVFCVFLQEFSHNNLEIGVGHGGSAITMQSYSEKLTCIDSWEQTWKKKDVLDYLPNANFIDVNSKDYNTTETFDLVHLDANKSYEGTLNDLNFCMKAKAKIIIVDDFLQSFWPNVSRATFDFVKNTEYKILFIGNHQAILSTDTDCESYKNIVINFPTAITNDITHLTYGKLPNIPLLNKMISASKLKYTWDHSTEESIVK